MNGGFYTRCKVVLFLLFSLPISGMAKPQLKEIAGDSLKLEPGDS